MDKLTELEDRANKAEAEALDLVSRLLEPHRYHNICLHIIGNAKANLTVYKNSVTNSNTTTFGHQWDERTNLCSLCGVSKRALRATFPIQLCGGRVK